MGATDRRTLRRLQLGSAPRRGLAPRALAPRADDDLPALRPDAHARHARAHARHLEQHRHEEAVTRNRFEQEVEVWLREQETQHAVPAQTQMLANQKAHLDRIKKRAQKARDAAKAHDQALIQELASRLRDD
ncbi:MAG: hypothetical protein Q8S73_37600 [Deltaproteobacteria bacterium]|nr:hypothetical protein [Deltaproteobacteria bacterium]